MPSFNQDVCGSQESGHAGTLKAQVMQQLSEIVSANHLSDACTVDGVDNLDTVLVDISEKYGDLQSSLPPDLRNDKDKLLEMLQGVVQDFADGLHLPSDGTENDESNPSDETAKPYHERVFYKCCRRAARMKHGNKHPYRDLLSRHGKDALFDRLRRGTRPFVWQNFVVGDKACDPEYIHGLGEDYFQCSDKGWYLIFVFNKETGQWEWWKKYVGQTRDQRGIRGRGGDHKRFVLKQDYNSLLYRS